MPIYEYVMPHIIDIETIQPADMFDKVKVFINGAWVGITDNPKELYSMLKEKKHQGIMNVYTSVVFDYKMAEIRVCNDAGRLMRPLLRVNNNNTLLKQKIIQDLTDNKLEWNDLVTSCKLDEAVLEYIDPEEQSWSMVAMKPCDLNTKQIDEFYKYTHCEIHPSTIFGVLASCIPFPEHNQSPRNTY
jgi:DNA-directed RNA polymerase II subunit RPB2